MTPQEILAAHYNPPIPHYYTMSQYDLNDLFIAISLLPEEDQAMYSLTPDENNNYVFPDGIVIYINYNDLMSQETE